MSILRCLLVLMAILGSMTSASSVRAAAVVDQGAHAAGMEASAHHAASGHGVMAHGPGHQEHAKAAGCDRDGEADRTADDDVTCCDPGACCPGVTVLSPTAEDQRPPNGFAATRAGGAGAGAGPEGPDRPPRTA